MKRYHPDIVEKLIIQQGKCFFCGFPMPLKTSNPALSVTKDHFIPRSKGGKTKKNIVLCHSACNSDKADNMPTGKQAKDFKQFRNFLKKHRRETAEFYQLLNKEI